MGRTALLMIIAFNIIFVLLGKNLQSISSQAYKNYTNYYNVAETRFVTESAANIAIGQMSANNGAYYPTGDTYNLFQNGGTYKTTRVNSIIDGDSAATFTIRGTYGGIDDTTIIIEKIGRFSRYAMFSDHDPSTIEWGHNNVCDGPFYTGGKLKIRDDPTFWGPVTATGGIDSGLGGVYHPNYNGGAPKTGPVVDFVADFTKLIADAAGGKVYTGVDTYLEFKGDRVIVRTSSTLTGDKSWNNGVNSGGYNTASLVAGEPANGYLISTLAPNGVLLVKGANLHIKGVLDGRLTVGAVATICTTAVSTTEGNVYIDSSIAYAAAPPTRTNPSACDDMLGIVADNEVLISKFINHEERYGSGSSSNHATYDMYMQNTDITINASIIAKNGGLKAEHTDTYYNMTSASCVSINGGPNHYDNFAEGRKQTINVVGGIQQNNRRGVGNGALGFDKNYVYDPRLMTDYPPSYPRMARMQVVSWYDKLHWDSNFWD
jgi:hypothetical protein